MPLAIATESSHLSLFFTLFLSLPPYPHNLFPSVCTHMCLSAFLFSVSSTLYLLLRPLSSFPSSRPPCEPTERRFNPSPNNVKINGFSRSFLYAASPLRSQKRAESMRRCNAAASLLFPYSWKPTSVFLTLAGWWRSSIRVLSICRRVSRIRSTLLSNLDLSQFFKISTDYWLVIINFNSTRISL